MPSNVNANLPTEDADLFFELMWDVQFYVNSQLGLLPKIKSVQQYAAASMKEKYQVREALWEKPQFIGAFIAENASSLPPHKLQLINGWKHFVAGRFYIVRFLKRYTVFVANPPNAGVYGVVGLHDRLEDVIDASYLPILVEAVLLPFKGRIVYDGLLSPHSVSFGPGISGELNEMVQSAKQKDAIIESLEPGPPSGPIRQKVIKPKQAWRPALDRSIEAIEKVPTADTVVQRRAMSVLKASAQVAHAAADDPNNLDELYQLTRRAYKALQQLEVALSRAE